MVVAAPLTAALVRRLPPRWTLLVGGTLIARSMASAHGAPTMGGAFSTAALNLGALVGPVLGGTAIGLLVLTGPLVVSTALAGSAVLLGRRRADVGPPAPALTAGATQSPRRDDHVAAASSGPFLAAATWSPGAPAVRRATPGAWHTFCGPSAPSFDAIPRRGRFSDHIPGMPTIQVNHPERSRVLAPRHRSNLPPERQSRARC